MAVPDKSLEFVRLEEKDQFGTQRDKQVGRERMKFECTATHRGEKVPPELLKLSQQSRKAIDP